jgi:hypothetical protein
MTSEHWLQTKWRPITAMVYLVICSFDFIIAPILWTLVQAYYSGAVTNQWQPITLAGSGLFHISFGAILGVSAFTRGQEKIAKVNTGYETTLRNDE